MRDEFVSAALLLAFAVLVTAHVTIASGLLRRRPRWLAAAALIVPPLAPYLAHRCGMPARGAAWLVGGVAYGILLWLACR